MAFSTNSVWVWVCGFYLKYYGDEDDACAAASHHGKAAPPLQLELRPENIRQLLAACFIPMLWSGGFYLSFVWMAVYMTDLIPRPFEEEAFAINNVALFPSVCVLFPIAGGLSARYGRRSIKSAMYTAIQTKDK